MTPSKRNVEQRIEDLESESGGSGEEIFVVHIGGDESKPTGWLSHEEYEQHYGGVPDSDFTYNVRGTGQ